MKIYQVPNRELNCCGTVTPCLAYYFFKSCIVDHVWKLRKRHPIHFWYVCNCFMAALLSDMKRLLWRSRDVDFADQGMGCYFFLFLGWKIADNYGQSARYRRQPAAILNPDELLFMCTFGSFICSNYKCQQPIKGYCCFFFKE